LSHFTSRAERREHLDLLLLRYDVEMLRFVVPPANHAAPREKHVYRVAVRLGKRKATILMIECR
jgi:hypothetical protein